MDYAYFEYPPAGFLCTKGTMLKQKWCPFVSQEVGTLFTHSSTEKVLALSQKHLDIKNHALRFLLYVVIEGE